MIRVNTTKDQQLTLHREWLQTQGQSGTRLEGAVRWSHSNLNGAVLTGSNLDGGSFRNSTLLNADLRYADLRGCDFRYADLGGADLREALLSGSDFTGSRLDGVRGLDRASVSWHGMGPVGHSLLCVRIDGILQYFCSDFQGTAEEMQIFIDQSDPAYASGKRKAMWIVSDLVTDPEPSL